MKKRKQNPQVTQHYVTKKQIVTTVLAFLLVLLMLVPLPYYIESPGSAESLRDVITVDGQTDDYSGNLMMTTVSMRRANLLFILISQFKKNDEVIAREKILGTQNSKEYQALQEYNMQNSQHEAMEVALELAGIPYDKKYEGIFVMSVEPYSSFMNQLSVGDLVTQLDGQTMGNSVEFIDNIQKKAIDEEVTITYYRHDVEKLASGYIVQLPDNHKKGIGISFVDKTSLSTKPDIKFHTEKVSGPSAGLMFSLELYSLLTGTDLTQERNIAGTGTINNKGQVGRIGGIDKKVVAAEQSGATIFLAPNDTGESLSNYEEAKESVKRNNLSIEVVPITNITDAIDYLKKDTTK